MRTRKAGAPAKPRPIDGARIERLRADARRPMNVNLAEGIALSHTLLKFAGTARQR